MKKCPHEGWNKVTDSKDSCYGNKKDAGVICYKSGKHKYYMDLQLYFIIKRDDVASVSDIVPCIKIKTQLCNGDHNYNAYVMRIAEACIGVLGIEEICHFTSRDIGYNQFYFQGYRILFSIFMLLPGILNIYEN